MNYAHILLDRSGSMQATWTDTLGAINAHVETLAKKDPALTIVITVFDSEFTGQPTIKDVRHCFASQYKPLTAAEIKTGGGTPLFDAIGQVISTMRELPAAIERRSLVIMTDGQENSSRTFTSTQVKNLLNEARESKWLIVFLGADEAVFSQGIALGAPVASGMSYNANYVHAAFAGVTRSTCDFYAEPTLENAVFAATFTDAERAAANTGKTA